MLNTSKLFVKFFYFMFFKKFDFDPDPELPEKSDPEIIFLDPTYCFAQTASASYCEAGIAIKYAESLTKKI